MKFWPTSKRRELEAEVAALKSEKEILKSESSNLRVQKFKFARAYAGAVSGRLVNDWIAKSTSIDAEVKESLIKVRNRARQLGRDNDYVTAILRSFQNNIIGKGIGFQSQVMINEDVFDDALNSKIETEWKRWNKRENCHAAGTLSFAELQKMLVKTTVESGEIYVRLIYKTFGNSRVPLALQLVEGDQLCEEMNGVSENGNEIRMGVELNEWGRPIAYFLKKRHPGDYQFPNRLNNNTEKIRVLADDIIPVFMSERVGQTRGITWLRSSIMRLHQMSGYEESEVIAARAAAALMGFIQSPEGEPSSDGVQDGEKVTDFEPGVFKYLGPGETVNVPDLKRPGGQYTPFMSTMQKGVSAGSGTSYETVSSDYSQSNYSSTRQSLINERDNWKILQAWFIEKFHQRVFERWLDMAVLSGVIAIRDYESNPEKYQAVQWMPRGWTWIDPYKDVLATKEAIDGGLETITNALAQSGQDIETVFAQRKKEKELAEKYGISLGSESNSGKKETNDESGDVQNENT